MGFRRNGKAAKRERDEWQAFLDSHKTLLKESGLPPSVVAAEELFCEFLEHGYVAPPDQACFDAGYPEARQSEKLEELVDCYFGSGRPFCMPMALDADAQDRLRKKFGAEGAG